MSLNDAKLPEFVHRSSSTFLLLRYLYRFAGKRNQEFLQLWAHLRWHSQSSDRFYTAESHFSDDILQNVVDAYQAGNRETHDALKGLRRVSTEMKHMFQTRNLSDVGQLLNENWHFQKQLHPSINTGRIDELFNIAKGNGCSGGKACGAGGGGCLVFHCEPDRRRAVRRVFSEVGAQVIPFRFDFQGFRTWSPQ